MDLWVIIGLSFAFLTLISLVISTIFLARALNQEKKLRTLEYVTNQFDILEKLGSREELRKTKERKILDYVNSVPDEQRDSVVQKLVQYVYAFNRIGAGIYKKALAEDIVFQIWTPKWFEGHWAKFESFIMSEKERRGEEASKAYVYFHWLAKVRCPKVSRKYPQYQPRATMQNQRLHSNFFDEYLLSQALTYFIFGLLSILAFHLASSKAGLALNAEGIWDSIANNFSWLLAQALAPVGIAAIVWAFLLLVIRFSERIRRKLDESRLQDIRQWNDTFYWPALVVVYGASFATIFGEMIQTGMGKLYLFTVYGMAMLVLVALLMHRLCHRHH